MDTFCPRCGADTPGYGPRGLCESCYREEHRVGGVPEDIEITVCPHCGRLQRGMDWVEIDDDPDLIAAALKGVVDEEQVVATRYEPVDGDFRIELVVEEDTGEPDEGQHVVQDEHEVMVHVTHEQCESCAKFHGGYYRYVLQLRGAVDDELVGDLLERAGELTAEDREDFVADVQEKHGGVNILVSTRDMAEGLIKTLEEDHAVEKQRSKELVGREDGQDVYRSVISLRIT